MIVLEHSAQPFATDYFSRLLVRLWSRLQDPMVQPLVRSFAMIAPE
jgi:hypothetical protein